MTKISSESKNTGNISGNSVHNNILLKTSGSRKRISKPKQKNNNHLIKIGATISIPVGIVLALFIFFSNQNEEPPFPIPYGEYELIGRPEFKRNFGKIFQTIKEQYTLQPTIVVGDKSVISENPGGRKQFPIQVAVDGQFFMQIIDWQGNQEIISIDYAESQNILKFNYPSGVLTYQGR